MMRPHFLLPRLIAGLFAFGIASLAQAQRPYIGYVYPAGGQQGKTFEVRVGGQGLTDLDGAIISGKGVTARVVEYMPRLNNQEVQLLREQLRELRQATPGRRRAPAAAAAEPDMAMMMASGESDGKRAMGGASLDPGSLIQRIESRVSGFVQNPAAVSVSNLVVLEVTVAADAEPGDREIRLSTMRGVTNPLVFQIGTLREYAAEPMATSPKQVLGKEADALRKRGAKDGDRDVELPCTVNGQLGPGEINRFHFHATKGQRLVFSAACRYLIPYIADAVPGWFQAVLSLQDAKGREISYDDDYNFKPDPVILFTVPEDGDYTLAIHDAIYRGREDFVYRVSLGELPFITSCFPVGGEPGKPVQVKFEGVNLPETERSRAVTFRDDGIHHLSIKTAGLVSNAVSFAVDELPGVMEVEDNNSEQNAQALTGPVIVNGRIDRADDVDVYRVTGKAGETLAVEVTARRLDSPLDSFVTVSDAQGKLIAMNDDTMDLGDGVNTHHADSYLLARLPEAGTYFVRVSDRAHHGGAEYVYRLRVGPPQPDFALRVVPSSLSMRNNAGTTATVYVLRKDDYDGPVRLTWSNPPPGFSAQAVIVPKGQTVGKMFIRGPRNASSENVTLNINGTAKIAGKDHVRTAVGAEDMMQAFLWRHLVPAGDVVVTVFDPSATPPNKRRVPELPPKPAATVVAAATPAVATAGTPSATPAVATTTDAPKPQFTKQQVAGRLRQLRTLYEAGLLTDSFYLKKVEECEAAQ